MRDETSVIVNAIREAEREKTLREVRNELEVNAYPENKTHGHGEFQRIMALKMVRAIDPVGTPLLDALTKRGES